MDILDHHVQYELCKNRPPYRQGRKLTAVKTYTVASESIYLLICGVPKLNLRNELKNLCQRYGQVLNISICDQYKTEDFTESFKVKFQRIQSSRIAKRMIDTKNFYGGSLHVCYAPEYETVEELRDKMKQRRLEVLTKMKRNELERQKNANLQENTTNDHLNLEPNETVDNQKNLEQNSKSDLYSRMFQVNNFGQNFDSTLTQGCITNYPFFPSNLTPAYEPFSINSSNNINNYSATCGPNFNTVATLCGTSQHADSNLEQAHKMDADEKREMSENSAVKKNKKEELEYVFKRKRSKKDKELKSKIEMLENALNDKTLIGPQYDMTDLVKAQTNSASGRVVVCGIDGKISTNRIFSNPKKTVNQININIKKD